MSFITPNMSTVTLAISNGPQFGSTNETTCRTSINFRNVECDRPVLNVVTCSGPIFGASGDSVQLDDEDDSDAAESTAEVNGSDEADVPSNNSGSEVNGEECSDNAEATDSDNAEVDLGINDDNDVSREEEDDEADASDNENNSEVDDDDSDNAHVASGSNDNNGSDVSDEDDTDPDVDAGSDNESTSEEEIPSRGDRNSSTKNDRNSAKGGSAQRNAAMEPVAGPSSAPDRPPPTTDADSNLHLSLTFLHDILKSGLNSESYSKLKSEYAVSCESLLKGPVMNKEIKKVLTQEAKNTDETIKEVQDKIGIGISALNTAMNLLVGEEQLPRALRAMLNACRIFADLHYGETKKRQAVTRGMLDDSILGAALRKSIRDDTLFGTDLKERVNVKDIKRKSLRRKTKKKVVPSSQSRSTHTSGQNSISVKQKDPANKIPKTSNAESSKPNPGPSNTNLEPSTSNHVSTTSDPESPTSHLEPVTSNSKPIITSLESAISTLEDTVSRFMEISLTNQLPSTTDNDIICDKMTISGLRTAFQSMERVISSYKEGITIDNTTSTLTDNPPFLSDKPTASSQPASTSTENSQIMTEKALKQDSKPTSLKEGVNQQVTTSKEGANSATTLNPKATTSKEGDNSACISNPKATTSKEGANSASTSNPRATTSKQDANSATTSNPKATTSKEGANSASTSNPRATTSKQDANSATTSNPKATTSQEGANSATTSNPKATTSKEDANPATNSNPKTSISREVADETMGIVDISSRRSMESAVGAAAFSILGAALATIKKVLANLQSGREINPESRKAETISRQQTVYSKNLHVTELDQIVKNLNAYIMQQKEQHKSRSQRFFSCDTMVNDDEKITSEKSNTTFETRLIEFLTTAVSIIQTAKSALTLNPLGSQFIASNADAFVTPIEFIHSCLEKEVDTIATNDEVASSNQAVVLESLKNAASILRLIISDVNIMSTELDTARQMREDWNIQATIEELKNVIVRFKTAISILDSFNCVTTDQGVRNYPWSRPLLTFVKKYTDIHLYLFNIEACVLILTNTLKQEPGKLLTKANQENIIAILEGTLQKMEKDVTTLTIHVRDQNYASNDLTAGNTNQNDKTLDLEGKQVNISHAQNTVTNAEVVVSNIKATPLSHEYNVTNQKTAKMNNKKEDVTKKQLVGCTDLNKGLTQAATGSSQVLSNDSEFREDLREQGELESMINSLNDVITSVKTDLGANLKQFDENFQSRLNNIKTQLGSKISNIDTNNTHVMNDAADINRTQTLGIRNVKRIIDKKAVKSNDVLSVTKTRPAGGRDEHAVTAARPEGSDDGRSETEIRPGGCKVVHKITETRPGGSKDVHSEMRPGGNKDVHSETEVRSGESKSVHSETETRPTGSKGVHSETEIRPGESKSEHSETETRPTRSKGVHSETEVRPGDSKSVYGVTETRPTGSKGVHSETDVRSGESKSVHGVTETRPTGSKGVHSETEVRPGESKSVHSETETRPTGSKGVHSETEIRPGESKIEHSETETRPTGSKGVHSETEARPGDSKSVHSVTETRPTGSEGVHSETEVRPGESKSVHSETETRPIGSKDVHSETEVRPGDSESAHGVTETRPTESKGVHSETEVRPGESKTVHGVTETQPRASMGVHNVVESQQGGSKNIHNVTKTLHGGDHNSIEATSVKEENSTPETQTNESEEYRSVKDIIKRLNDVTKTSNTDKNKSERKN